MAVALFFEALPAYLHFQLVMNDLFSRFVNWLSNSGQDRPALNKTEGGQDFFSKMMNSISG